MPSRESKPYTRAPVCPHPRSQRTRPPGGASTGRASHGRLTRAAPDLAAWEGGPQQPRASPAGPGVSWVKAYIPSW